MGFFPSSGKHKCNTTNKAFNAVLGTGAAVVVSINGKMNGLLGGFAVTGFGHLEYTYAQGATEWVRTDMAGSAQGPASIPVADPAPATLSLVYDPAGKCNAKVSIDVTGDADVTTDGFKFKHKKDVWKMKGRTDKLTINITQEVVSGPTCDSLWTATLTNVNAAFLCGDYDTYGSGAAYAAASFAADIAALVAGGCGDEASVTSILGSALDDLYATNACA